MADVVNRGTVAGDQSADSVYVGFGKINTEFAKDHGVSKIHASTAKDEPVDADEVGYSDSADTFKLKKISIANLKNFLKGYFDTIYSTLGLGTSSSTAFRGDYGNTAYNHSQAAHAPVNSQKEVSSITNPTASFTLALTDAGAYIKANSASAIVITIPPSGTVNFPVGTVITICQDGAGAVSVTQGSGVTLNYFKGLKVAGQRAAIQLIKVATDTWDVIGGIA